MYESNSLSPDVGPSQIIIKWALQPIELIEDTRPLKRARPDESITATENNSNNVVDGANVPDGPQAKGKGKNKVGRPQKGCEECKRSRVKCSGHPFPCKLCINRGCASICPGGTSVSVKEARRAYIKTDNPDMKMKQMAERIKQLEEGLATRHAEFVELAHKHRVPVDTHHPLLQEHYTKIKKLPQTHSQDSARQNRSSAGDERMVIGNNEVTMAPQIHNTVENILFQRLRPVDVSYKTGEDHICLEGTRRSLFARAEEWIHQPSSSTGGLFCVIGPAGSGKSSFANTLAQRLDARNDVDLTFFSCERGHLTLSDPERLLRTILYHIACKHDGYRARLTQELSKNEKIHFIGVNGQFQRLVGDVLPNLAQPTRPHAIVIDAFDACGDHPSRSEIAICMLEIAETVPWIKVLVTSRSDQTPVCLSKYDTCTRVDLGQEEETYSDIRSFIQAQLEKLKLESLRNTVDALIQYADGEFFRCRTLFRYLGTCRNPGRNLVKFLSEIAESTAKMKLYYLYDKILESTHPDDKDVLQVVLGIIYICSDNRPLSAEAIACFIRYDSRFVDEDPKSISSLAQGLHAVLYEENNAGRALHVCHPSFLDYLRGKLTGNDGFTMNLSVVQQLMATGCLEIMHRELKFNICCLESSYCLNKDVPDLEERIFRYMSEALQYSSLFWFDHISQWGQTLEHDGVSQRDQRLKLDDAILSVSALFMSSKALHWLEVLSFLGRLTDGVSVLQKSIVFFRGENSAQMMSDLERFVLAYAEAMESAPHVYLSALAWLPEETLAYEILSPSFSHLHLFANKVPRWEGARWTRNVRGLSHVALAPNGHYVATGHDGGRICIWDARTTEQIQTLRHHTKCIPSVVFSSDGSWLASIPGCLTTCFCIWRLATGELHAVLESGPNPNGLAFSMDGTRIAACFEDGAVYVWNVEPFTLIFHQTIDDYCTSITFSADSERILLACESLETWNIDTGARICTLGCFKNVSLSTCSRDGKYIAAAAEDGSGRAIKLWDAQTYEAIGEIPDIEDAKCLSFTADGKQLYHCSRTGCIRTWSTETFALIKRIDLLIESIEQAEFYADSDFRSILVKTSAAVSLFDVQYDVAGGSPNTFLGSVAAVAISSDGKYIASCHYKDRFIHIWDGKTGAKMEEPLQGHSDRIEAVAFSNDGRWLVSGSKDKTVRIWDIWSNCISGEPLLGHTRSVRSIVVSPDSHLIASHSWDKTVCIWEISTRSLLGTFDDVCAVSFFPDSRRIAIASYGKGGRVFDVLTGDLVTELSDDDIDSVAVSSNGQWIAYTAWLHYICFRNLDGSDYMKKEFNFSIDNSIYDYDIDIAFTPDSRCLITIVNGGSIGDPDNRFVCWNVETGEQGPMWAYSFYINSIRYKANLPWSNDKYVALSYEDGPIHICDTTHWCISHDTLIENSGDNIVERARRERWREACSAWDMKGTSNWVKDADGRLLLWVPFQYRDDIRNGRKLVIGSKSHRRAVRPTIDCVKLLDWAGEGWTSIYRPNVQQTDRDQS